MSEIERPPHYGQGPETRTEMGEAGPSYEDFPTGSDLGFAPMEAPPDEAIQVEVVGMPPTPDRLLSWRPNNVLVQGLDVAASGSGRPAQIGGVNRNRTRLFVKNTNAAAGDSVFLVTDSTTDAAFGYELQAQDTLELFHNEEVWAVCLPTETARVSYSAEYVIDE